MTHYLYIPGLGDNFDSLRLRLLRIDRDSRVTLIPMRWSDPNDTPRQKSARISRAIERVSNSPIVLIGESAGATATLIAFTQHPDRVSEVLTVCGFNHGSKDIHPIRKKRHPALFPMSQQAERAIAHMPVAQRRRITTIYSTRDTVVKAKYSHIDGARVVKLRIFGHAVSIGYFLLKGPAHFRASAQTGRDQT